MCVRGIPGISAVCAFLWLGAACDDKQAVRIDAGSISDASSSHARNDAALEDDAGGEAGAALSFFVSSDKSMTGDLGGLIGADARCNKLAAAVGAGDKTWRAYLSVEHDPANGGKPTDARDRIGRGPWYNARGALLAKDLDALHARTGDADVFLDEHGNKIRGQWPGSPPPVEHDVLTGSNADGTLMAGQTCADWTSSSSSDTAQVGHSDGLGPGANADPPFSSWNSAHANAGCNDTAPRGGAGRIYCFAID
jgi:hypothetical protein